MVFSFHSIRYLRYRILYVVLSLKNCAEHKWVTKKGAHFAKNILCGVGVVYCLEAFLGGGECVMGWQKTIYSKNTL